MNKKSFLAVIGLTLSVCSLTAQTTATKSSAWDKVVVEMGLSALWNTGSNRLGTLPIHQQSELHGLSPSLSAKIMYRVGADEAWGLAYSSLNTSKSLPTLSEQIKGFAVSLVYAREHRLAHSSLRLRNSLSLGYAQHNSLSHWASNASELSRSRHGASLNYDLTLLRPFAKRHALGVQVGVQVQYMGQWSGEGLSPQLYDGKLFGKSGNWLFTPHIGIVLTNPFGK